jgi:hypothetical protein
VNANKFVNVTDLGTFLFGQERNILDAYRTILLDVQKGVCLYCQIPLSKQSSFIDQLSLVAIQTSLSSPTPFRRQAVPLHPNRIFIVTEVEVQMVSSLFCHCRTGT